MLSVSALNIKNIMRPLIKLLCFLMLRTFKSKCTNIGRIINDFWTFLRYDQQFIKLNELKKTLEWLALYKVL